jgi:heme-degrading monooxygenase HmoA
MQHTLQEFQEEFVPQLEQLPGFQGLVVAVNWRGGTACALSLWETQEAMRGSAEMAGQARATTQSRGQPAREPIHDDFEVVLAKLPT